MKKIRLRTVFAFLMAVLAGALLLHTSQNVQKTEAELSELQAAVDREKDSIRILKTEWAYLNNPERLERLARQFLKLAPSDLEHIKTDGTQIPPKIEPLPENAMQAQPVSYVSPPPSKPLPPASSIPSQQISKEKTLDDILQQVSKGGAE